MSIFEHPSVEACLKITKPSTHDMVNRLATVDLILRARLDAETYELVVEATELAQDIVLANLD